MVLANDGIDGLEKCKAQRFDLILTNQNMVHMNGQEMIKALRLQDGYEKTPILMLTTEAGADIKDKGRSALATGCLVKPFQPERLVQIVKK